MPLGPEVISHHVVSPQDMDNVLEWIDNIPLSRPKKSLARDFSDGVLVAELIHFSVPKFVELHNYIPSHSGHQKKINWEVLNRRVLVQLNLKVGERAVQEIVAATPGAVDPVLWAIRKRVLQLGDIRPSPISLAVNASRVKPTLPPRNRPASVVRPMADVQRAPAQARASSRAVKRTYLGMAPAIGGGASPAADENNNSILDEIPKILYRGQEMVDYNKAVELIKENSDLLMAQKELERKVALSEKLIEIKEKRIEELSKQFLMEKRKSYSAYPVQRLAAGAADYMNDQSSESENSGSEQFHSPIASMSTVPIPQTPTSISGTARPFMEAKPQFAQRQQPGNTTSAATAPAPVTKAQGPPRRVYLDI